MARKTKLDAMLEELVRGKTTEEILGDSGLVRELTKRVKSGTGTGRSSPG